jgi:vitamin B12 transporter
MRYKLMGRVNLGMAALYVGRKYDFPSEFGAPREKLAPYTLVNATGSYDITGNIELFARGDNILNRSYEDVKGYGTAGVSGFGGFKVKF